MSSPSADPDYPLTLRQADQARGDFAAIIDEPDLMKWQIERLPTRAYFCRSLLIATASGLGADRRRRTAAAVRTGYPARLAATARPQ
jgi:hypothetical protein